MGSLELSYDVKDLDKLERLKSGVDHYHTYGAGVLVAHMRANRFQVYVARLRSIWLVHSCLHTCI
jgi:hypothetical protein